ncbi:MAG: mannitol dehydrogenase family protein, partial [Clostridiales Family XIII bacterium]|nr:mannitol dehydrogenase family protein [Clostridiales Family XIII bacterium]
MNKLTLSNENLKDIAERLPVPQYDRKSVTPGIMHFGASAFHRAHQAKYLDDLMNEGKALDFGIIGVGIMKGFDERMRDALKPQDCLYTLVAKDPFGSRDARVVGSIVDYLYGPDDEERVLEKMASPEIKIVSLTITEGGYNFDQITGEFIADNPDVIHDLNPANPPRTVFAYIYRALKLRKDRGVRPFTVMSCDNIQENGTVCKKAILAFAGLVGDEGQTRWIDSEVHFPSCMVDRITPRTTEEDIADIAFEYGVADNWPVVTEDFIQWVLTDDFGDGESTRPPYEDAGVLIVNDIIPYELMKLRLLNASHQGIAYFGHLMGYELVDEAVKDPLLREFLAAYMDREATPTLQPIPGVDFALYKKTLLDRFSNAAIKDTVARLAAEASDRIPKWLVPVIEDRIAQGG